MHKDNVKNGVKSLLLVEANEFWLAGSLNKKLKRNFQLWWKITHEMSYELCT